MKFKKLKTASTLPPKGSSISKTRSPEYQKLEAEVNATGKWFMISTNGKDASQARSSFPNCTVVVRKGNVWIGPKEAK